MKHQRTVLEVLFPKVRAEILRLLFSTPAKKRYIRELHAMSGLALSTVQDELRKLTVVGLIISWRDRGRRFYGPNRGHPLFSELLRIVQMSERLPQVKHSQLQRPRYRGRSRERRRPRFAHLPIDRQPRWGLFARKRKPTA